MADGDSSSASRRLPSPSVSVMMLDRFREITRHALAKDVAMLYCALTEQPISRNDVQPVQGNYWRAEFPGLKPAMGWKPIAPV